MSTIIISVHPFGGLLLLLLLAGFPNLRSRKNASVAKHSSETKCPALCFVQSSSPVGQPLPLHILHINRVHFLAILLAFLHFASQKIHDIANQFNGYFNIDFVLYRTVKILFVDLNMRVCSSYIEQFFHKNHLLLQKEMYFSRTYQKY